VTAGRQVRVGTLAVLAAALLGARVADVSAGAPVADVTAGDAAWAARAEGALEGRPLPEPIRSSLDAYERALADRPHSLEVRWKLVRSLHFAGTFTARDEDAKRQAFERAAGIADEGLDWLAERVGDGASLDELGPALLRARLDAAGLSARDVARLHFWSALSWGAWSRTVGLLSAVRQGVAGRLHRYASVALALEPGYDEGGPYRLLGRLHARLPRVPFLSGWVERERAIPLLEAGYALAPENPGNQLLLAVTLLELAPERRSEAIALLDAVADLDPRPEMRIEDLAMRDEARERRDREASANDGAAARLTRR
jgi:hypothetical protein